MLIDDDLYRWAQIGVIVAVPAGLLLRSFWKRRFGLGIFTAVAAFFALAFAGSVFTASQTTTVYRVEFGFHVTKAVAIGSARYRFDNGTETVVMAAGRQRTVVIDNTDKPIAIMPVIYSYGGFAPREDKPDLTIAPFTTATSIHDIEYYGQGDHAPPHTIQANASQATRYWLTDAPH